MLLKHAPRNSYTPFKKDSTHWSLPPTTLVIEYMLSEYTELVLCPTVVGQHPDSPANDDRCWECFLEGVFLVLCVPGAGLALSSTQEVSPSE